MARELRLDRDLERRGRSVGGEGLVTAAVLAASESVMAQVVEAAIGAVFVSCGPERTIPAVIDAFAGRVAYAAEGHVDHKTVLQEHLARQGASVTYALVESTGPDHDRRFTTAALVEGRELGRGSGPTKKASEQAAARRALHAITGGAPPD